MSPTIITLNKMTMAKPAYSRKNIGEWRMLSVVAGVKRGVAAVTDAAHGLD